MKYTVLRIKEMTIKETFCEGAWQTKINKRLRADWLE